MTKDDLREVLSQHCPTVTQAALALDALLDAMREALERGEAVRLHGIGTLTVVRREGRTGTAPNGAEWSTGPSLGVRFKVAAPFRDRLNPL